MTGGLRVFLRTSFSPVSFSSISFNGARKEGHSGYWRLFFTQMQEAADTKPEPAELKATSVQPETVKTVQPDKKKPTKTHTAEPVVTETVLPFRPLPMYEAKPNEPTYLQQMWDITLELRVMVASLQQIKVKFNTDVVCQDEDDIELLLLTL